MKTRNASDLCIRYRIFIKYKFPNEKKVCLRGLTKCLPRSSLDDITGN